MLTGQRAGRLGLVEILLIQKGKVRLGREMNTEKQLVLLPLEGGDYSNTET